MTAFDRVLDSKWFFRILGPTLVVLMFVSAWAALRAANNSADTRTLQRDNAITQARTDCARAVNAERNEAIDALTVAKARVDQLFIAAVLAPPDQGAAVREPGSPLSVANMALNEKIVEVENLPRVDEEVDRRCPG